MGYSLQGSIPSSGLLPQGARPEAFWRYSLVLVSLSAFPPSPQVILMPPSEVDLPI